MRSALIMSRRRVRAFSRAFSETCHFGCCFLSTMASPRRGSAPSLALPRKRGRGLGLAPSMTLPAQPSRQGRKIERPEAVVGEPAYVGLKESAQIVHAVFEHGDAIDSHAP